MSTEARERRLGISHMAPQEKLEYLQQAVAEDRRKEMEARLAKTPPQK